MHGPRAALFKSCYALMPILCFHARVRFFRFKKINGETEIDNTPKFSDKDIYPIFITPENKDGILGSCAFLQKRTDVTRHVRSESLAPLLNLQEALEKFVEFSCWYTHLFNTHIIELGPQKVMQ